MHSHANTTPAMVPAVMAAPAAPALTGAVMCAVSLAASRPLQIKLPKIELPKLPKIELPKLPSLDLPNFGKKKDGDAAKAPKQEAAVAPTAQAGNVKIRASNVVQGSKDAPSAAELAGRVSVKTIGDADGFKRFPSRRMPGANMDNWKGVARDITPKM